MDIFRKDDLIYEYEWSPYEKDDPRISGNPDDTEFNRKKGPEMMYIITHLTDHLGWDVENFGGRMERLIHDQLPESIKTQKDTITWIQNNWTHPAMGKN
jgi:hypothetical protein